MAAATVGRSAIAGGATRLYSASSSQTLHGRADLNVDVGRPAHLSGASPRAAMEPCTRVVVGTTCWRNTSSVFCCESSSPNLSGVCRRISRRSSSRGGSSSNSSSSSCSSSSDRSGGSTGMDTRCSFTEMAMIACSISPRTSIRPPHTARFRPTATRASPRFSRGCTPVPWPRLSCSPGEGRLTTTGTAIRCHSSSSSSGSSGDALHDQERGQQPLLQQQSQQQQQQQQQLLLEPENATSSSSNCSTAVVVDPAIVAPLASGLIQTVLGDADVALGSAVVAPAALAPAAATGAAGTYLDIVLGVGTDGPPIVFPPSAGATAPGIPVVVLGDAGEWGVPADGDLPGGAVNGLVGDSFGSLVEGSVGGDDGMGVATCLPSSRPLILPSSPLLSSSLSATSSAATFPGVATAFAPPSPPLSIDGAVRAASSSAPPNPSPHSPPPSSSPLPSPSPSPLLSPSPRQRVGQSSAVATAALGSSSSSAGRGDIAAEDAAWLPAAAAASVAAADPSVLQLQQTEALPHQGVSRPDAEVEVGGGEWWSMLARQGREIFKFAGPALGTWLCSPLMSLIDTAVVGSNSSLELAALGPGAVVVDNLCFLFMFLSVATSNLVATSMAQKDTEEASNHLSRLMFVALSCGVATLGLTQLFAAPVISAFTGSQASLVPAAAKYAEIRGLALPAVLVTSVTQSACLGLKDSMSPLRCLLLASGVNLLGDIVLCTFLGQGIAGAAWATTASQYAGCGLMLVALAQNKQNLKLRVCVPSPRDLWTFVTLAGPIFLTLIGKVGFYTLVTYTATSLGTVPLAAHQVIIGIFALCAVCAEPLSQTAQSFLPRLSVGSDRNLQEAEELVKALAVISLALGAIEASAAAVVPCYLPQVFTSDPVVIAQMRLLVPPLCTSLLLNPIVLSAEGVLLAGRDVLFLAVAMLANVGICGSLLLVSSSLQWGLVANWWILVLFQIARIAQAGTRILSPKGILGQAAQQQKQLQEQKQQ